jgi:hypothetical protein
METGKFFYNLKKKLTTTKAQCKLHITVKQEGEEEEEEAEQQGTKWR